MEAQADLNIQKLNMEIIVNTLKWKYNLLCFMKTAYVEEIFSDSHNI